MMTWKDCFSNKKYKSVLRLFGQSTVFMKMLNYCLLSQCMLVDKRTYNPPKRNKEKEGFF